MGWYTQVICSSADDALELLAQAVLDLVALLLDRLRVARSMASSSARLKRTLGDCVRRDEPT